MVSSEFGIMLPVACCLLPVACCLLPVAPGVCVANAKLPGLCPKMALFSLMAVLCRLRVNVSSANFVWGGAGHAAYWNDCMASSRSKQG